MELRASRMLARRSAVAVRIIVAAEDVAVLGTVEYEKKDTPRMAKMRWQARRAGLPRRLWLPPDNTFGNAPFGVIQLPVVETKGRAFLLETTVRGVWPQLPFGPILRNFTFGGNAARMFDYYREFSGVAVKADPSVSLYGGDIQVCPDHDNEIREQSDLIRLIEDALREQAGIIVTQRGSNTVTFTWDEKAKFKIRHNFYIRGEPSVILDNYQAITGAVVKVDPNVCLCGVIITVHPDHDLRQRSEAIRLMEDALREQAGIVVTRRGSNSVNFASFKKAEFKTEP
jgi:hypothetical protein